MNKSTNIISPNDEWNKLKESICIDLRVRGRAKDGNTFLKIFNSECIDKLKSLRFRVGEDVNNLYPIDYPEGSWDPQELINQINAI